MQVVLVRWRPSDPARTPEQLRAMVMAGAAPADRIAHVRVDGNSEEWRLALFVEAATGAAARTAVQELVGRTAAVLPVPPDLLDVELVTEWFQRPH